MLISTLIIGTLLRLYNNTAVALWHDEAFSALYIRDYGWGEMMHRIGLDVHPPLYYILLRLWHYVFGTNLVSLRSFSILFGVLTIWAGYLFVKELFGDKKTALFASLLLALNPFQIQYSLEARMYTLGTFLVLLVSYVLVKALKNNQTKYWAWYAILVAASLYTHYYLVFSVLAQSLYALYYLIKRQKITLQWQNSWIKALGSYVFSFILYLPWLPTLLVQIKRVEKAYWIPAPDRWSIPGTIWKMVLGGQGTGHLNLIIGLVIGIIFVAYFIKKVKAEGKWLVLLGLIVPFVGALLLSFKQAIYLDRYFVFASLFFTILIAMALHQLPRFAVRRTAISLFVIILLVAFFKNWQDLGVKNLFFNRSINKKPGMAQAAEFVNDRSTKIDQIYLGSSFVYFTFKYYNRTPIHPQLISQGQLQTIPHFSGTALLKNNDLILTSDLAKANKNQIVWLVWTTGFGGSKPNVPANWREVVEQSYADTPGFKGEIVITEYHVN